MGKTLVLMRHGKAQSRDLGIPDDERTLTRAGKRTLAATLPRSLQLWCAHAEAEVWTSPAVRCRQTADALVTALRACGTPAPEPLERAFLHDRDIDVFLVDLLESDADCVVCVGHNPFIEEAMELLTGARIHFRPGALAAIELPDEWAAPAGDARTGGAIENGTDSAADGRDETGTAEDAVAGATATVGASVAPASKSGKPSTASAQLLWFVQGASVDPWKTLCELEDIVKGAHGRMEGRLAAFLADPDDVEALHKLRVSIRTLRSLLKFLAPFHRARAAAQVQRDLRSIVVPTSRLRELDVLVDEARELEPPSNDLVAACLRMRAEERDRVLAVLESEEARRALARIAKAVKRFAWKRSIETRGLSRTEVAQRFADMEAAIGRKLAATDPADAEATHDLRKAAKRVRYSAENYAAFLDVDAAAAASGRMKAVQDDLGALCDARVNVGIVGEFPREGLSDQALRDLAALEAKSRYLIATKLRACGRSTDGADAAETAAEAPEEDEV